MELNLIFIKYISISNNYILINSSKFRSLVPLVMNQMRFLCAKLLFLLVAFWFLIMKVLIAVYYKKYMVRCL